MNGLSLLGYVVMTVMVCANNLVDKPDTGFLESAGGRSE